jgi:hypothetical protein
LKYTVWTNPDCEIANQVEPSYLLPLPTVWKPRLIYINFAASQLHWRIKRTRVTGFRPFSWASILFIRFWTGFLL